MNRLKFIIEESFRSVLKEYAGMFAGCEQLAKNILYIVKNCEWPPVQNGNIRYYGVPCEWAPDNEVLVSIQVPRMNALRAAYLSSFYELHGKIAIALNPKVVDEPVSEIIPTLTHELTHAYEDSMRRKSNSSTIDDLIRKNGYYKSLGYQQNTGYWEKEEDGGYRDEVSNFIMRAISFERGARIARMYADVMQSGKEFKTPDEMILFIEETRTMRELLSLKSFVEDILHPESEEEMNEWIAAFNDVTNLKFGTYRQLQKYCQKQLYKFESKVMQMIPKIIAKYFYDRNKYNISSVNARINMSAGL